MSQNVRLKSSRQDSIESLVRSTPTASSKARPMRSPRELKKEARDNVARMEHLEMVLASSEKGAKRSAPKLRRRPHHHKELERRRSAALIMQAIILFVVLAAAVGWLNQRFHFWGQ